MTAPVASSYPSPQPEPNEHPRPLWAVVGALVFVVFGLALLVPAVHIATEPILLPTAATVYVARGGLEGEGGLLRRDR